MPSALLELQEGLRFRLSPDRRPIAEGGRVARSPAGACEAAEVIVTSLPTGISVLPQHLESYGADIFGRLAAADRLRGLAREQFIGRLAEFLADVNALHPFARCARSGSDDRVSAKVKFD